MAVYASGISASSIDFSYRAWLGNSRTRRPARVYFEPRPVVVKQEAWVLLPSYCGLRRNWRAQAALDTVLGSFAGPRLPVDLLAAEPFEEYQKGADIVRRLPGSSARVAIKVQKPVIAAQLQVLGQAATGSEAIRRQVNLSLHEDGRRAGGNFNLEPGDTAYRIVVQDEFGFANSDPPRRGIRSAPPDPSQVALLPEQFRYSSDKGSGGDYEVEGMPVPLGRKVRIGYTAAAPNGLSRAWLGFRVLPANRTAEGQVPDDEIPWIRHALAEIAASPATGSIDLQRGLFENSGEDDQVEFHAIPSSDPDKWGRKEPRTNPSGAGGESDTAGELPSKAFWRWPNRWPFFCCTPCFHRLYY